MFQPSQLTSYQVERDQIIKKISELKTELGILQDDYKVNYTATERMKKRQKIDFAEAKKHYKESKTQFKLMKKQFKNKTKLLNTKIANLKSRIKSEQLNPTVPKTQPKANSYQVTAKRNNSLTDDVDKTTLQTPDSSKKTTLTSHGNQAAAEPNTDKDISLTEDSGKLTDQTKTETEENKETISIMKIGSKK